MGGDFEWIHPTAADDAVRKKAERERLNTLTEESARCGLVFITSLMISSIFICVVLCFP